MRKLNEIVQHATIVSILGGGEAQKDDLALALSIAPDLICVDSGANVALGWGKTPLAVLGDLDSVDLSDPGLRGIPVLETPDQDFGDFDKTLAALGGRAAIAVGFLGGRLDHQLAAITALSRAPGPVVMLGAQDVICMIPREIALDLAPGTRVSLWPLVASAGRSRGLHWPIDGLRLDPTGRVGTSNAALGGEMRITVTQGEILLILPRDCLSRLVAALTA